jgi:hypothetical protein
MLFCLLGASRQQRGEAPAEWGERIHCPLENLFPLNLRRNAISFSYCSVFSYQLKLTVGVSLPKAALGMEPSAYLLRMP